MKVKQVNKHIGEFRGQFAVVLDYTIDGKKWINHGIYCGKFTDPKRIERIKKNLLEVGPIVSREEQVFGYE